MKKALTSKILVGVVFLALILVLPSSSALSPDELNGYDWADCSSSWKLGYVMGWRDGALISMHAALKGPFLQPVEESSRLLSLDPERARRAQLVAFNAGITGMGSIKVGRAIESVDHFYEDSENEHVLLREALWLVLRQFQLKVVLEPLTDEQVTLVLRPPTDEEAEKWLRLIRAPVENRLEIGWQYEQRDTIGYIQGKLIELGYDVGDVDGLLGPRTRAAIKNYCEDQNVVGCGLSPDALLGLKIILMQAETPTH